MIAATSTIIPMPMVMLTVHCNKNALTFSETFSAWSRGKTTWIVTMVMIYVVNMMAAAAARISFLVDFIGKL